MLNPEFRLGGFRLQVRPPNRYQVVRTKIVVGFLKYHLPVVSALPVSYDAAERVQFLLDALSGVLDGHAEGRVDEDATYLVGRYGEVIVDARSVWTIGRGNSSESVVGRARYDAVGIRDDDWPGVPDIVAQLCFMS